MAIPAPSVVALSTPQLAVGGLVLLVAFVAVFWVFFSTQFRWAIEEPADWGHTLLVPGIAAYFAYMRREDLLAAPLKANWLGAPVVLLGVAAYVATTFGPGWFVLHHNARGVSVGITLLGLALLIAGTRVTRILLFPIGYWIVFGQSVSERLLQLVTERLQDWSAVGAHALLAITGVDVERSGNVLTVFVNGVPNQLNVAEACSGMRMLVAFLALGVNVLRVYTLGILSLFDANFAAGDFHSFVGLVWLVPALLLYLGIMWFLRNLFVDESDPAQKRPDAGGPRAA